MLRPAIIVPAPKLRLRPVHVNVMVPILRLRPVPVVDMAILLLAGPVARWILRRAVAAAAAVAELVEAGVVAGAADGLIDGHAGASAGVAATMAIVGELAAAEFVEHGVFVVDVVVAVAVFAVVEREGVGRKDVRSLVDFPCFFPDVVGVGVAVDDDLGACLVCDDVLDSWSDQFAIGFVVR